MQRSTYLNPVHDRPCPDPFVLKHLGEYWCYSTGFWHDGRCFGVMHSRDLIEWREMAGAMEPFAEGYTCYWAPEVTYDNGRFFMYYSVGNEERMQIRVAVADHPAGPFIDSGHRLTTEEFAIDPHVLEDSDGARYFFYATDFLTHTHVGTGTVVDQMIDLFTLAGNPRPVTRARYDWQVYDPKRAEKGGVRWHTVEGPFVLKRKGLYYEMFSGGNWKNITYGVSYAVTDDINTQDEWEQASDGEKVLPILRTIPGKVIGPGHNSVVRGPDNRQLFCIYHRWAEDSSDRVLAIDGQDWAGNRIMIAGPSTTPQFAPIAPALAGFSDYDNPDVLSDKWICDRGWVLKDGALIFQQRQGEAVTATARCVTETPHYVMELSLKLLDDPLKEGVFGLELSGGGMALRFSLAPESREAVVTGKAKENSTGQRFGGQRLGEQRFKLPPAFDMKAFHLLRLEVSGKLVSIALDGIMLWQSRVDSPPDEIELFTHKVSAAFAGLALAYGWEDLFTEQAIHPSDLEWHAAEPSGNWSIQDRQLWSRNDEDQHSMITKGPLFESCEVVVNARLDEICGATACYGLYPALGEGHSGPLLTIERDKEGWALITHTPSLRQAFALPGGFDAHVYHQFRFRKAGGRLNFQVEGQVLGEIEAGDEPTRVGLFARSATAAFDMVRVTAIIGKM